MFCLVYASAGTQKWSRTEVESMLAGFRENNASLDVTGLLLYNEGSFIQVLEGDESVVLDLYHKIERDERHHLVTVMLEMPTEQRSFPDWSMGFRVLDSSSGIVPEGLKTFRQALEGKLDPHGVIDFVRTFAQGM